jgi:hypothetical protein
MKLRYNQQHQTIQSNVDNSDSVSFGIKQEDIPTVINILCKSIYENPIQTLVQEYLANARDAHRIAGKDKEQIQVTLPTKNHPYLKIRDFGAGMSDNFMRTSFVNVGSSTKRDSNQFNGEFGIGAKSVFSYTDSFVLKTYISEIESHWLLTLSSSQELVAPEAKLSLLKKTPTKEKTGTEIIIGVKEDDIPDFVDAVCRATLFWDTQPLLFKKDLSLPAWYKTPQPILKLKNCEIYSNADIPCYSYTLVVDGILYEIDSFFSRNKSSNQKNLFNLIEERLLLSRSNDSKQKMIIKVDSLDVQVSANRENIPINVFNTQSLNKIGKKILKELDEHLFSVFSRNKTLSSLYIDLNAINKVYDSDFIKKHAKKTTTDYNGCPLIISNDGTVQGEFLKKFKMYSIFKKRYSQTVRNATSFSLQYDYFFYLDDPKEKMKDFQRNAKNHIKAYEEKYKNVAGIFTANPDKAVSEPQLLAFLNELNAISASSIQKIKQPVSPNVKKRLAGSVSFHVYSNNRKNWNNWNLSKNQPLRSFVDVNLRTTSKTKYVYVSFAEIEKLKQNNHNFSLTISFFNKRNIVFGGLSEESIKQVQYHPDFQELSNFLKKTFTAEQVDRFSRKMYNDMLLNFERREDGLSSKPFLKNIQFIKESKTIKDPSISRLGETLSKISIIRDGIRDITKQLPDSVYNFLLNECPEFQKTADNLNEDWATIKLNFPLFSSLVQRVAKKRTLAELAFYVKGRSSHE